MWSGNLKVAKEAKNPWEDFCDTLYWLSPEQPDKPPAKNHKVWDTGKFGFPLMGFKSAAVDACTHVDGIKKVEARGAFHLTGWESGDYVWIEGKPTIREDMVRVGMGTADIRYRGEFKKWACTIELRYNFNVLSVEEIVNLFNTAGFAVGVGDYRPEKNGRNGMFHVATEKE